MTHPEEIMTFLEHNSDLFFFFFFFLNGVWFILELTLKCASHADFFGPSISERNIYSTKMMLNVAPVLGLKTRRGKISMKQNDKVSLWT